MAVLARFFAVAPSASPADVDPAAAAPRFTAVRIGCRFVARALVASRFAKGVVAGPRTAELGFFIVPVAMIAIFKTVAHVFAWNSKG